MSKSSEHPPEHQPKIEQVFEKFGEPGYFLSPHKSRLGKFVFKNLWGLSVILLILVVILFIRHFSLSTVWEYRRLIYQYHTLYQDELISLGDFDELEWKILNSFEVENNYNEDPDDDSTYWMFALTRYLGFYGDLIIPPENPFVHNNPNLIYCYDFGASLSDCYWEFFYEVMSEDSKYSEETAINAIFYLDEAGYMSEPELYRLYDEIVENDPISETTRLEIQAHFVRGFLLEAKTLSTDSAAPGNGRPIAGVLEGQVVHHQLNKISSYLVHLLDRFLVQVATITFMVVTIFWSRSFFNISKQAPLTLFQLASIGRLKVPETVGEVLAAENIRYSWLKRQWILGRQLAKAKPRWQDYAVDLKDSASSPWALLLFIFWMAFLVFVLNLAGMDFSQLTMDSEQPEVWLIVTIGVIAAYIYAVQFWMLFVVARYLQMLPDVFDVEINFKHYDRSGGLGRIGNLSFKMAMIYIVPAIFIAVFLSYIIYRSTTEVVQLVVIASQFNWLLSVIFLIVVVLLALANLTFFLPLWGIHKQMALKKIEYEDNALLLTIPIDDQLQQSVLADEEQYTRIAELERRLLAIELVYPSDIRLSTWPISTSAFISFLTTQVIPIISLVGTVISLFA